MSISSTAKITFVAAVTVALAAAFPAAAEEGTVTAFSSWQARGQIFPTGPTEATFVGVLSGIIYVKGADEALDASSIDAGLITCPSTVEINTEDGSQKGKGKCVIVTGDAERIYAKFQCAGTYLQGCNGDFTLAGGSGEKANISGGGPIQLKSALGKLAVVPGTMIEQSAVGFAVWPKLTYKLP